MKQIVVVFFFYKIQKIWINMGTVNWDSQLGPSTGTVNWDRQLGTVNWDFGHRYFNKLLPNVVFAEN